MAEHDPALVEKAADGALAARWPDGVLVDHVSRKTAPMIGQSVLDAVVPRLVGPAGLGPRRQQRGVRLRPLRGREGGRIVTAPCVMPQCNRPPTTTNRAKQPTCEGHRAVVVSGSWMGEGIGHHEPNGDDQ